MFVLTEEFIRNEVADSNIIYRRGESLYHLGAYSCIEADRDSGEYVYEVDGNYGDYLITVDFNNGGIDYSCDCPYPGEGCKHAVAVLLDIMDRKNFRDHPGVGAGAAGRATFGRLFNRGGNQEPGHRGSEEEGENRGVVSYPRGYVQRRALGRDDKRSSIQGDSARSRKWSGALQLPGFFDESARHLQAFDFCK